MIFEENQVYKRRSSQLKLKGRSSEKILTKNDFQIEINAKADAISALKKSLRKIRLKYEKALVQHKK